MKKRIAVLLTVAMAAAAVFSPMTAAAASGTASSIRLEQTQGSVTVKNSAGKELKASSGSRLNSGSSVSTAKASYAYMSLDSSKAAKLDASSKASVRKSGSKLELRSEKGSLMFNVSSPLKSSENMNIRTSSMVAGVRGTAGWVFNPDANTSVIYLLEGALDVSAIDPVTGEQKQVTITGGQGVFATRDTSGKYAENGVTITIPGMGGPRTIILREETESLHVISFEFKEEDVPGFVAVEVAKDPQLQQKITDLTDLSVPEIIGAAEEKLASEEAAAEEKDTEIQQALEEVTVETTNQVFESTKESSSGGGGGSSGPVVKTYNVSAADYQEIVNGIAEAVKEDADVVNVTMTYGNSYTSSGSGTLSVPENMTVNLDGTNTLNISGNDNLQVDGTLNVADGTVVNVQQGGTVSINSMNSLHVKGTLENSGTIYVGTQTVIENGSGTVTTTSPGALSIEEAGSLNNLTGGMIKICEGSNLTISTSTIQSNPSLGIAYPVSNYDGGTIEVSSGGSISLTSDYFLNNSGGTITVSQGAEMKLGTNMTLTNNGTITNSGSIDNQGNLRNNGTTSRITNYGKIANGGTITNDGTINNNGTMTNDGTITIMKDTNQSGSDVVYIYNLNEIINNGAIGVYGLLEQNSDGTDGTLTNNGQITIYNGGSLLNSSETCQLINNAIITNDGTITNNGEFTNNISVTVTSQGSITNSTTGIINNYNELKLEGVESESYLAPVLMLSNAGTINIYTQGSMTLQGNSQCTVDGKIYVENGTLTVNGYVRVNTIENIKDATDNSDLLGEITENGQKVVVINDTKDRIKIDSVVDGSLAKLSFGANNTTSGVPALRLNNDGKLLCLNCAFPEQ